VNLERVLIDPEPREAREARKWLMSQGDMRGFLLADYRNDPLYLFVFDSYGATHESAMRWIRSSGKYPYDHHALIFRIDNTIYHETDRMRLRDLPSRVQAFLTTLYHPVTPRFTRDSD
jgi:hypothetical protein